MRIVEVVRQTPECEALVHTADELDQARYVVADGADDKASIMLGAFEGESCVGFLRLVVQIVGSEEGRTAIRTPDGAPLTEGFVEAFGVLPSRRRRGIGQRLQERAIAICRDRGCYQMRSKSPVSSAENYALKLKMGYGVHPDTKHDAYFFMLTL